MGAGAGRERCWSTRLVLVMEGGGFDGGANKGAGVGGEAILGCNV
jgi:hypothetical protein